MSSSAKGPAVCVPSRKDGERELRAFVGGIFEQFRGVDELHHPVHDAAFLPGEQPDFVFPVLRKVRQGHDVRIQLPVAQARLEFGNEHAGRDDDMRDDGFEGEQGAVVVDAASGVLGGLGNGPVDDGTFYGVETCAARGENDVQPAYGEAMVSVRKIRFAHLLLGHVPRVVVQHVGKVGYPSGKEALVNDVEHLEKLFFIVGHHAQPPAEVLPIRKCI